MVALPPEWGRVCFFGAQEPRIAIGVPMTESSELAEKCETHCRANESIVLLPHGDGCRARRQLIALKLFGI